MFEGYDYVWMGHVHKPQVRLKKPYIAHIGSLDISDFGETDHTKIAVVYDTENPNKFLEIPVPSRPLRKVILSVPVQTDTTEYLLKELEKLDKDQYFKDAIVKIEVKLPGADSTNAQRNEIEKFVYSAGAYYICNFSESRNITVVPVSKQSAVDNSIEPKAAVKLWADTLSFETEEDKQTYINFAVSIIEKVNSK